MNCIKSIGVFGLIMLLVACQENSASQSSKIAFHSDRDGNSEIYTMDPDGTNQTNLTNHSAKDVSPQWSPDGKQLLFISDRNEQPGFYIMNADGSNVHLLIDCDDCVTGRWFPDGKQIAFVNKKGQICIIKADGANIKCIADQAREDYAYSPDGKQIAFASSLGEGIYVIDVTGANLRLLTEKKPSGSLDVLPDWSPDGKQIIFQRTLAQGNIEIHIMNSDGSNERTILGQAGRPKWSPAGDLIAFKSRIDNALYLINSDGSKLRKIADLDPNDYSYIWSPNGTRIAFVSMSEGRNQIYVVEVNDSNLQRLTNNEAWDGGVSWQVLSP
ncbi:MAG: hypothetical protein WCC12_05705 [Anaerolineales bacterium]